MAERTTRDANHQRALELVERKEYGLALGEMEESLTLEESSEKWNDWGMIHVLLGNLERGQRGLNRALALDPRNVQATDNLALLLRMTAPELDPDPYVRNLFDAYHLIPMVDPALPGEFRKALSRNDCDSEYKVRNGYKLLQRIPEFAKKRALERLAEQAQSDPRFASILALERMDAGDFDRAIQWLWSAWELHPTDLFTERLLMEAERKRHGANPAIPDAFAGLEEYLAGHFCDRPWRHLEFSATGDLYPCCPAHVPVPIGSVQKDSVGEVRNSPLLQAIRQSILDGTFHYCSKTNCALLTERSLPRRDAVAGSLTMANAHGNFAESLRALEEKFPLNDPGYPKKLVLSYDRTCNLACPSCRSDFYTAGPDERGAMGGLFEKYVLQLAQNAEMLFLDGAGEVFASRHSRELLKKVTRERYPQLKIRLITNAMLLDAKAWETFDLAGRVEGIWVSMDAAREETYNRVRRGGDFQRLLRNLEFLQRLRERAGETFQLEFHFVVSAINFREMPDFVRFGKRFHVERVVFSLQRNWGHLSKEEMSRLAVFDAAHPEHQEFLEILRLPEINDPVVFLGPLRNIYRRQETARRSS